MALSSRWEASETLLLAFQKKEETNVYLRINQRGFSVIGRTCKK